MAKTPKKPEPPKAAAKPAAKAAPKSAANAPAKAAAKAQPKAAAKPVPSAPAKDLGIETPKTATALPGVRAPGKAETQNPNRLKTEQLLAEKMKRVAERNQGGGFDHRSDPWSKGGKGQTSGGPPAARPFKGGGRGR